MTFLGGKISIFAATIFFNHRPDFFRFFPFFFQIFPIFAMLNVIFDPFLTRKTPFFYSVHTFTRFRQHYFSKYWGDQCMGRPPPPILGRPTPSPPRSPPLYEEP